MCLGYSLNSLLVGLCRGTGATSNDNYATVFATYLYTVKVFSMSDLPSLYLVMILQHYAVTNITPLAARIQPAPRYLAPMRHIRGEIRAEASSLRAINIPLKKKKQSLFTSNQSPSHCLATQSTSWCLSRNSAILPNLFNLCTRLFPAQFDCVLATSIAGLAPPYRVFHTMRRACLLINHDCPLFPASDRALRC